MGGILLSFVPTILQVHQLVLELERDGRFQRVETVETLLRPWHVTQRSVQTGPPHGGPQRLLDHRGTVRAPADARLRPSPASPGTTSPRRKAMEEMSRDSTIEFLRRHVKTEMLMKHLYTVEAAMRGYARRYGEDEDRWGIAGLLHDFDWEICPTPEEHPNFGAQIMRDHGYPEDMVRGGADPRRTHRHSPGVVDGTHAVCGGRTVGLHPSRGPGSPFQEPWTT